MDEITDLFLDGNSIIFDGKKRYYIEDLTKRDYSLENTTPHLLKIGEYEILENKWGEMIRIFTAYLISILPNKSEMPMSFKTDWSNTDVFSSYPRTNYKQVDEKIYVNCNHTAVHSCWLIQDLLKLFKIDVSNVFFLIHRPPAAETSKVREYFILKFKKEFSLYLKLAHNKSEESITKILYNIENYMDPILKKISKSYNSFMLFEDYTMIYNYTVCFLEYIESNPKISERARTAMKRYINYLREFYKI